MLSSPISVIGTIRRAVWGYVAGKDQVNPMDLLPELKAQILTELQSDPDKLEGYVDETLPRILSEEAREAFRRGREIARPHEDAGILEIGNILQTPESYDEEARQRAESFNGHKPKIKQPRSFENWYERLHKTSVRLAKMNRPAVLEAIEIRKRVLTPQMESLRFLKKVAHLLPEDDPTVLVEDVCPNSLNEDLKRLYDEASFETRLEMTLGHCFTDELRATLRANEGMF